MSARLKLKKCKENDGCNARALRGTFEIEIKGIRYIFNSKTISYIILGDESLPSYKSTRVSIVFTNGKVKCFCFEDHENAERLYNKLFELV